MTIHIVEPGDSVTSIAEEYGVSEDFIIYVNQLVYPYSLTIGQAILIPGGAKGTIRLRTNGYAYTYISNWVLRQTLPFLSVISVFSYGFTMEGELVYPEISDREILEAAAEFNVSPILTLTPLDENGIFNNNLISSIVNNEEYSYNLINQVLQICIEKGYRGVDIDFEYIKSTDRERFTEFVGEMADVMHENGLIITIALAPKTSADQRGLLYEGKDYKALGEIVDYALLMTYEWGYKYGPNMAVAPIDKVERVVEYAVTEIPPYKLNLGIPNYGYDWRLPFVMGESEAVTIGNVEAVQIAIRNGVPVQYDETAQSPFFRYFENGEEHEVWFEDARSIQAKLELVKKYNLAGTGCWQLMRWWRVMWLMQDEMFEIEKY